MRNVMLALSVLTSFFVLGTAATTGSLFLPAGLDPWIAVWSAPGTRLSGAEFEFGRKRGFSELYVFPDSLENAALIRRGAFPPNWVLSPDSALAVCVPRPGHEPDSEIDVIDLSSGRRAAIWTTGTGATFEFPCWIDSATVLVGGGNWERVAPLLVRIDMTERTLEWFDGPALPQDHEPALYQAVQGLWDRKFAPQR
jgi:hypothetical protein